MLYNEGKEMTKRNLCFSSTIALCIALALIIEIVTASDEDAAVVRTRHEIEMLDTLYKSAIVLITDKYVSDPSKFSGASAAKALFATMKENGYHEVRLVGLTDVLNNPSSNKPKDAFEEDAKNALLNGESTYEAVTSTGGIQYLRKATPVPVVLEKCAMCHANFKDNKGVIGMLAYTVPLIK
jgi:hypothetical protein